MFFFSLRRLSHNAKTIKIKIENVDFNHAAAKYLNNGKKSEWKSNRSRDQRYQLHLLRFFCQREDRQITDGCCFCMDIPAIPSVEVKTHVIIMSDPFPAFAPQENFRRAFPLEISQSTSDQLFAAYPIFCTDID